MYLFVLISTEFWLNCTYLTQRWENLFKNDLNLLIFTCVRAGLYVGLVSSSWDNELTFLSAVETLVSCEKFDHL